VSVLDYGKIYGALPPDAIQKLFRTPYPNLSKIYFKLFGFPDPAGHVRFPQIMKFLEPMKSDLILDVGCGLGMYANTIAMNIGSKCVGIDLNRENLEKASVVSNKLNLKSEFKYMYAKNLEFLDEQFDKVLCIEVLEHLSNDNQALDEMARVLKPGGILVLSTTVKTMSNEKEQIVFALPKPLEHVRSGYEYESLKAMIEKTGLSVLKVGYWYRWFTKQALKLTYFFTGRKQLHLLVLFYPFLTPLGVFDKLHQKVRREKGFYRGYIILARKSIKR